MIQNSLWEYQFIWLPIFSVWICKRAGPLHYVVCNTWIKFIKLQMTVFLKWFLPVYQNKKYLALYFTKKGMWLEKLTKGLCGIITNANAFPRLQDHAQDANSNRMVIFSTAPHLYISIWTKRFQTIRKEELVQILRKLVNLIWHPRTTFYEIIWRVLDAANVITTIQI